MKSRRPALMVHGIPTGDAEQRARLLKELGFDSVVAGLDRETMAAISAAGLSAFVCTGTFTVDPDRDPDLLAVDVDGQRRFWFGSGCPNQPALRSAHMSRVLEALSWPEVSGFYLDGIRFASPNAGLGEFLTCFCAVCESQARHMGFDFQRMRTHVQDFRHSVLEDSRGLERCSSPAGYAQVIAEQPGVADWLAFRAACIERYVGELAEIVANERGDKRLCAYLFTPSLSPLVGQNYARLERFLATISPMTYRMTGGDSVLGSEVGAMAGWSSGDATAVRAALRFTGLAAVSRARTMEGLRRGFSPSAVAREARLAAEATTAPHKIIPIITLRDARLHETVSRTLESGVGGVSFFAYQDGTEGFIRQAADAVVR